MDFKDLEELKYKLLSIKKRGFIQSHRKDNTGIGKTLEDEMNITENNIPEGDFKIGIFPVELKAQRRKASSRITLSTKEPEWLKNKLETITKTGYKDKAGRHGLKITLNAKDFNPKGYKLNLTNDKISITHKILGDVCFFNVDTLVNLIKAKIGENLLLVLAEVKKNNEEELFHYTEAIYFSLFDEESFKKLINESKIIWEFRLHLKPSGAIRDHGSGFRINRRYLSELYKNKITLISFEEQK